MSHRKWEMGKGGLEGEQKREWDWRRDIGVTGGSGLCWNREEKGRKRVILLQLFLFPKPVLMMSCSSEPFLSKLSTPPL